MRRRPRPAQGVSVSHSPVAIVRCADSNYDPARVEADVRRAVDLLGGIARFVRPGQRVLLKPNLLRKSKPADAVVTHPTVVRAMVRLVQEAGGRPIIGDSPGGAFSEPHLRDTYAVCGLRAVAEETGAELNFDLGIGRASAPSARLIKAFDIAQFALNADVIISLAKCKTHGLVGFTGATKNMFGVVPGITKAGYHAKLVTSERLAEMLLDLLEAVRPAFTLMDAIVGMDGNGPSAGRPFPMGLLLASTDPVALDLAAVHIVGLKPDHALTLRVAQRRGLTSGRIEDVPILGTPLSEAAVQGFKPARTGVGDFGFVPAALRNAAVAQFVASPKPSDHCVGCGICVDNCPQKAITLNGRRITINLRRCIRCYCCHELCPSKAIDLTEPLLQKLVK